MWDGNTSATEATLNATTCVIFIQSSSIHTLSAVVGAIRMSVLSWMSAQNSQCRINGVCVCVFPSLLIRTVWWEYSVGSATMRLVIPYHMGPFSNCTWTFLVCSHEPTAKKNELLLSISLSLYFSFPCCFILPKKAFLFLKNLLAHFLLL